MSPDRLNRISRLILLAGIVIAISCMVSGLTWLIISGKPFATSVINPLDIPGAIIGGDPNALIDLGIVALIATPFVRVLAVFAMALSDRDRQFTLISATVVGLILLAVLIGLA
jgi:uncharacterized membrane protein